MINSRSRNLKEAVRLTRDGNEANVNLDGAWGGQTEAILNLGKSTRRKTQLFCINTINEQRTDSPYLKGSRVTKESVLTEISIFGIK